MFLNLLPIILRIYANIFTFKSILLYLNECI